MYDGSVRPSRVRLAVLLTGGTASATPCASLHGLAAWVCSIDLTLPRIELTESVFKLSVEGMSCSQVQLSSMVSDVAVKTHSLTLSISGLSISCSCAGDCAGFDRPVPFYSALDVAVDGAGFDLDAQLIFDGDGLAVGAKIVRNTFNVGSVKIHFHKFSRLIDLIISQIEHAIQGYIEQKVVSLMALVGELRPTFVGRVSVVLPHTAQVA